MTLKDILVHIDSSDRSAARLDAAIALAKGRDAHLSGLYVSADVYSWPYPQMEIPTGLLEELAEREAGAAREAEALFRQRIQAAGVGAEWREVSGEAGAALTLHARYADLTILGQTRPEDTEIGLARDLPERVVLGVGRPVLVMPYAGHFPTIGERAMVAWNGGREATRAVADALPLLARAKEVTVLVINPEDAPDTHGDVPGADIALHLARHGVNAVATRIHAGDMEAANIILSRAAETGIDLLVMGAYGHSRLRELVVGGVTRSILASMTMPVLMSH